MPAFLFFLFLSFQETFGQVLSSNNVLEFYLEQLAPVASLPLSLPFHLNFAQPIDNNSDLLFYVHMPKTAGQAFHRILVRSLKGCPLNVPKCDSFGANDNRSLSIAPRFDLTYAPRTADALLLRNRSGIVNRFARFAAGLGHVDVSLSTQLPHRRLALITMLREPVARLSSMYNYMIGNTNVAIECVDAVNRNLIHYPNISARGISTDKKLSVICNEPMIRRRVFKNVSLSSYLENVQQRFERGLRFHSAASPYIMGPTCLPPDLSFAHFVEALQTANYDNYMTRAVTGQTTKSFLRPGRLHLSSEDGLMLAKQMLETFPFVGLTERFEDSVELYLWTFGFPHSSAGKEFVFNKSKRKDSISWEDEVRVRQMEHQDLELYKFGVQLFEKRFELMRREKQRLSPQSE